MQCHTEESEERKQTPHQTKHPREDKIGSLLEENISNCDISWDELKDILQIAAKHVFSMNRRHSQDWFDDQDEEIQRLLKEMKQHGDRDALRQKIRRLKNDWFQLKAEEAANYAKQNNHKDFYATLNAVYAPRSKNMYPVNYYFHHQKRSRGDGLNTSMSS